MCACTIGRRFVCVCMCTCLCVCVCTCVWCDILSYWTGFANDSNETTVGSTSGSIVGSVLNFTRPLQCSGVLPLLRTFQYFAPAPALLRASLVLLIPNSTANRAITYTNCYRLFS